ncbi:MAG: hypothetical protein C0432_03700 [Candidatus Puniceispirillum sp.]|nr:hypothetical protein [Candidatus Pelagibacter sp.]MBA4283379.1 hypothetical protein [Candidatus Puniceispirillum sp.]
MKNFKSFCVLIVLLFNADALYCADLPFYSDTDHLMNHKNRGWIETKVASHSAKDQLAFVKVFHSTYSTYKQGKNKQGKPNNIIPLGEQSKRRLKEVSSMIYGNLITDRYNVEDFHDSVACAIELSKCDFSNHYLFDALEYCFWTGDSVLDLDYARLFFSMLSCQYAPGCKSQNSFQHEGFEFHKRLGEIIDNQSGVIESKDNDMEKIEILTSIIIAYNMMKGSEYTKIREAFVSNSIDFPCDSAIIKLKNLLQAYCGIGRKKDFFRLFPFQSIINATNLYVSLLNDLICQTESHKLTLNNLLDPSFYMPSSFFKTQQSLMLRVKPYQKNNRSKSASGFENLVGKELQKLSGTYDIKRNYCHPNLGCEMDFYLTHKSTKRVIIVECDGYYHFTQNIHGSEMSCEINGLSWMRTNIFRKVGKVIRISGACSRDEYYKRINSIVQNIININTSEDDMLFIGSGYNFSTD